MTFSPRQPGTCPPTARGGRLSPPAALAGPTSIGKYIESTGKTTARVLSGERPENIPVVDDSDFQTQLDWRELRRWRIPQSALPPGAVILYREPSFWERGRRNIIAAIVLIFARTLLIAGLLWQRARK